MKKKYKKKFNLGFHSLVVCLIGLFILICYPTLARVYPLPEKTTTFGGVLFFLGLIVAVFAPKDSLSDEDADDSKSNKKG